MIMIELQNKLGYSFTKQELLKLALTHPSSGAKNNQRLEFLGDAVLELAVSDRIFKENGELPEGKLTKLRAELVREESLYEIAKMLGLGEKLILGKGEEKNSGRDKPSILADTVEAVIGAVYLDGGFEAAQKVIAVLFKDDFTGKTGLDYKSRFQEYCQRNRLGEIEYKTIRIEGPPHDRTMYVTVFVDGAEIGGEFKGKTKKIAEQNAAKAAFEIFIEKKEEQKC